MSDSPDPDGWVYTYNQDGLPVSGVNTAQGLTVTITYWPDGNVQYDYAAISGGPPKVTRVVTDPDGKALAEWIDGKEVVYYVELQNMAEALRVLETEGANMSTYFGTIKQWFQFISENWVSPSGVQYAALTADLNAVNDAVVAVLQDAHTRMKTAYDYYMASEDINYRTFVPELVQMSNVKMS